MDANKILNSSVLDILFEGRNKSYGAYDLRRTYSKRITVAFLVTLAVIILFLVGFYLSKNKPVEVKQKMTVQDVNIQQYNKPPPPKKAPPPPPPPAAAPPKIEMKQFTVPKVVKDDQVKKDETPPPQDEKLTIGPVTQHGLKTNGSLAAPTEVKGIGGTGKGPGGTGTSDVDKEFTSVQVEAKFPGGQEAWIKYVHDNLRENVPVDNGAQPGQYVITVSFLVSRDGSISEVKAVDAPNPDYGTAAEACRVIQRGPKWQPAIQNGRPVTYRQRQRVIFQVQE